MKITNLAVFIILVLGITSCQKEKPMNLENSLIGEWTHEYEITEEGLKNFDQPYALLEFNYSDGFILNEDGLGKSVWLESTNDDFEWEFNNPKLIFSLKRSDDTIDKFEFLISNLTENSLVINSPKEHKYFMTKK